MEVGFYKRLCLYLSGMWQARSSSTEARLDGRKIEDVADSFAPLFALLVLICHCDYCVIMCRLYRRYATFAAKVRLKRFVAFARRAVELFCLKKTLHA